MHFRKGVLEKKLGRRSFFSLTERTVPFVSSEEGRKEGNERRKLNRLKGQEQAFKLQAEPRVKDAQTRLKTDKESGPQYALGQVPVCRALQAERKMREQRG